MNKEENQKEVEQMLLALKKYTWRSHFEEIIGYMIEWDKITKETDLTFQDYLTRTKIEY